MLQNKEQYSSTVLTLWVILYLNQLILTIKVQKVGLIAPSSFSVITCFLIVANKFGLNNKPL